MRRGYNWQYVITGSVNGLTPNKQPITQTNDDQIFWRMYEPLGTCAAGNIYVSPYLSLNRK